MAEQDKQAQDAKAADPALAAALRANLIKRKLQIRGRSETSGQWSGEAAQPVTTSSK